mgnify:CR=1 FL=1
MIVISVFLIIFVLGVIFITSITSTRTGQVYKKRSIPAHIEKTAIYAKEFRSDKWIISIEKCPFSSVHLFCQTGDFTVRKDTFEQRKIGQWTEFIVSPPDMGDILLAGCFSFFALLLVAGAGFLFFLVFEGGDWQERTILLFIIIVGVFLSIPFIVFSVKIFV